MHRDTSIQPALLRVIVQHSGGFLISHDTESSGSRAVEPDGVAEVELFPAFVVIVVFDWEIALWEAEVEIVLGQVGVEVAYMVCCAEECQDGVKAISLGRHGTAQFEVEWGHGYVDAQLLATEQPERAAR
jgi:hypothetical protein